MYPELLLKFSIIAYLIYGFDHKYCLIICNHCALNIFSRNQYLQFNNNRVVFNIDYKQPVQVDQFLMHHYFPINKLQGDQPMRYHISISI